VRLALAIVVLITLSGCVSKEQYRSLSESYDAWFQKSSKPYLDEVKDGPQSVRQARQHEVDAVATVISAARSVTK
jgi:hypothetical protein